jgi:hypothetical protein
MNRQRYGQRGTLIAEFAVVLPVVILLTLLVAEGANLLRVYQVVANAAREGARLSMLPQDHYLAVNQTTNAHLTNPQTCIFRGGAWPAPIRCARGWRSTPRTTISGERARFSAAL